MTYLDHLHEIADPTVEQVLAAVARWQAGQITDAMLADLVAAFIAAGNSAAAALADLSLASVLSLSLGTEIAPLGITRPAEEPERLHKAATTLLGISDASLDRWARLARVEAQNAAATAYSDGISRSPYVDGWTRGLDPDPCQLCRWWSREGTVWPADHPMPTHKGCECVPIPVTR